MILCRYGKIIFRKVYTNAIYARIRSPLQDKNNNIIKYTLTHGGFQKTTSIKITADKMTAFRVTFLAR